LEANPVIRESVRVREEIVLPSLMIQQYALTKLRREEGDKDNLTRLVVRSLAANVNASRNSV
jgi:phosphoenolpyruvate carboxylase